MENFDSYLQKKEKKAISMEYFRGHYPEFFEAIGEETIDGNTKTYENEKLKVMLSFSEASIDDYKGDDKEFFAKYLRDSEIDLNNYWKLDQFEIKNESNEYSLNDEKNHLIIFRKEYNENAREGSANLGFNFIDLGSAPSSPAGIATALHELGHMNDQKLLEEAERIFDITLQKMFSDNHVPEIDKEQDAMTLRRERAAWAYALFKLRPFFDGLKIQEDALEKFIHDFALGSYCKTMSKSY